MHETRKKYTVLLLSAPIGSGHRLAAEALEQALADRIAAGTARPGTLYTADADTDGHIILTESDAALCV